MFRYQTQAEIEEFVRQFAGELFSQSNMQKEKQRYYFSITVDSRDFYFHISGPLQRKQARPLIAAFNVGTDVVERINGTVSRYYAMRQNLQPIELLNAFSSKLIDTSGTIVTDAGLLEQAGSVPNEELLERLRAAKPPAFSPKAAGYVPGALVVHPHFGPGVVTAKDTGNMQAYFPKICEGRTLVTAD